MILEGSMAELAAQRATAADIERIEIVSREFQAAEANSDPTLPQKNREFHFAIYAAARHATLMGLVEPLWARCGPSTLALFEEFGHEQPKRKGLAPAPQGVGGDTPGDSRRGPAKPSSPTSLRRAPATSDTWQSCTRTAAPDGKLAAGSSWAAAQRRVTLPPATQPAARRYRPASGAKCSTTGGDSKNGR